MAFPDDYRRWQVAGGNAAIVDSHIGLLRQLLVDTTNLNIRLMDGTTAGGHKVVMDKDFAATLESKAPAGELAYVQDPDANDPNPVDGQAPKRLWTSRVMRSIMLMLADMTDPNAWVVKDAAMPETVRATAKLVTNLDEAVVSGWYRFVPNASTGLPGDLPSGSTDQYMMLVIRQSSAELTQMIIGREALGKIWTRSRVGGTYQAWTLATGVTSADLLNYVAKAGSAMTGKLTLAMPTNVLAQLRMLSGASPSAPNDGDIWRDDASGGIKFRKGGVTKSIFDDDVAAARDSRLLHVRDQKASGTEGGAASATIQVRTLNTVVVNGIPGASLSANQITLPAGKYEMGFITPAFCVNANKAWLRVAGGAALVQGTSTFTNLNYQVVVDSEGFGVVELLSTTVVELVHFCVSSKVVNGLGVPAGSSQPEVYAEVMIRRVD